MAKMYKGQLSQLVSRVRNLFGDNVKSYTREIAINLDGNVIGGIKSIAHRNADGAFKFNKGTSLHLGTIAGNRATTIIKTDGTAKGHNKGFKHNVFGYGTLGYTTSIIKNGDVLRYDGKSIIKNSDVLRYDGKFPAIDMIDSIMKVTEDSNGDMHVYDSCLVDCVPCDINKKVILNKVGIKINGAKVKETYNRNIGRYKPKHKDVNVNTNITQYLHSPKIYG